MIYIASPYTSSNKSLMEQRAAAARAYTLDLMHDGKLCYSPIVYGHQFGQTTTYDWQRWVDHGLHMLRASDELHLLQLPGWTESFGVEAELKLARKLLIPVTTVEYPRK